MGQECTITAYQHVRIGEQCVIADRAMFIDFDHGVVEVERPIRAQGIYKRDVEVGSNVWIGYGACVLRGVRVGDNSIVGTNSVVTKDVPANAVVGGIPARILRMREAPERAALGAPGRTGPGGAHDPAAARRGGATWRRGRSLAPRRRRGFGHRSAPRRPQRRARRTLLLGTSRARCSTISVQLRRKSAIAPARRRIAGEERAAASASGP